MTVAPSNVMFNDASGNSVPVTAADPLPVTIGTGGDPTEVVGNVASGIADSGNPVKTGGVYIASRTTKTTGSRANTEMDVYGNTLVALSDSFANSITFGTSTTDTKSASGNSVPVDAVLRRWNGTNFSRESYGLTVSRIMSAANTTNATSAKGSAGVVYRISGLNAAAAVRYVKVYNKATAPTVGTDTPILTLACAASVPFSFDLQPGIYFSLGIAYALTTGAADADTGALTAADILGLNVVYS